MEVKRWEVSRLLELYEAKKLNGEIKNIHAEIANQLNISERQARKYTTAEKLIPELSESGFKEFSIELPEEAKETIFTGKRIVPVRKLVIRKNAKE